jgi:hypothetical protein
VVGVSDEWAAYQLDLACLTLGRWVEGKLAKRDKRGNPIHSLGALLAQPEEGETAGASAFGSLRGRALRKVKIGPDGIW